jgi:hypothetical protein
MYCKTDHLCSLWNRTTIPWVDDTHSLTHSWSWALLEKLPIVQPLKNFPAFYGTWRFITAFTRSLHCSLSSARSIQSLPFHPISLNIHFNIVPWWRYLLGLQTTPLIYSHSFYSRLHLRYYNRSVTNSSHTNCVDCCASCWLSRTTLIPVLSCTVLSYSKAGWLAVSLAGSLTDWLQSSWLSSTLGST